MSIPPGNQPREPEFFNKGLQIRFGYQKSNDSIEVFKKSNIIQRFVHFFFPGLARTEKITDSTKKGNFYYVKKSDIKNLGLEKDTKFKDIQSAIMNKFLSHKTSTRNTENQKNILDCITSKSDVTSSISDQSSHSKSHVDIEKRFSQPKSLDEIPTEKESPKFSSTPFETEVFPSASEDSIEHTPNPPLKKSIQEETPISQKNIFDNTSTSDLDTSVSIYNKSSQSTSNTDFDKTPFETEGFSTASEDSIERTPPPLKKSIQEERASSQKKIFDNTSTSDSNTSLSISEEFKSKQAKDDQLTKDPIYESPPNIIDEQIVNNQSNVRVESAIEILTKEPSIDEIMNEDIKFGFMEKWLNEVEIKGAFKHYNHTDFSVRSIFDFDENTNSLNQIYKPTLINEINGARDKNQDFTLVFNEGAHYVAGKFTKNKLILFNPNSERGIHKIPTLSIFEDLANSIFGNTECIEQSKEHPQNDRWSCGYHCLRFALNESLDPNGTAPSIEEVVLTTTKNRLNHIENIDISDYQDLCSNLQDFINTYKIKRENIKNAEDINDITYDILFESSSTIQYQLSFLGSDPNLLEELKNDEKYKEEYNTLIELTTIFAAARGETKDYIDNDKEELIGDKALEHYLYSEDEYTPLIESDSEDLDYYFDSSDDTPEDISSPDDFSDSPNYKNLDDWVKNNQPLFEDAKELIKQYKDFPSNAKEYRDYQSIYNNQEYIDAYKTVKNSNSEITDVQIKKKSTLYKQAKEYLDQHPFFDRNLSKVSNIHYNIRFRATKDEALNLTYSEKAIQISNIIKTNAHKMSPKDFIEWLTANKKEINSCRIEFDNFKKKRIDLETGKLKDSSKPFTYSENYEEPIADYFIKQPRVYMALIEILGPINEISD